MPSIARLVTTPRNRLQPCPRCGAAVQAVRMYEHATQHCPRFPRQQHRPSQIVFLSSGRPSAQHDECAD